MAYGPGPFAIKRATSGPYAIKRSEAIDGQLMVRMRGEAKMGFRFEGLNIFHEAIDFSVRVYSMAKKFPAEERFDLTSRSRRAANSVVLNIAEGSGRGTKRDFSRFLDLALGSTFEAVACSFLAKKQGTSPIAS